MNRTIKISDNVTFQSIENNIYILDINNGEYYKLSETASMIWKEISQGSSINDIKFKLKSLFHNNDKIYDDIDEAIKDFLDLNLIKDN